MPKYKLSLCLIPMLASSLTHAFGPDICYSKVRPGRDTIHNCFKIDKSCRTSDLNFGRLLTCKKEAVFSAIRGLTGTNEIIAGRSLVHADATYVMAQLLGFSPWQAYQIMIYAMAPDRGYYDPYTQSGKPIFSKKQIQYCRKNWGDKMPEDCLLITPEINGTYKFNAKTGGMQLHMHALFTKDPNQHPAPNYPTNYLQANYREQEVAINNLREWLYNQRNNACASGITTDPSRLNAPCASTDTTLKTPVNLLRYNVNVFKLGFTTQLGPLIINQNKDTTIYANNHSFAKYIYPDNLDMAKLGIFLHALADRYSHHLCIDNAYMYQLNDNNYNSVYKNDNCDQGSHMLHHVWEQATLQTTDNLSQKYQTIKPALTAVYKQLEEYADYYGVKPKQEINQQTLMKELTDIIQIYNPTQRLESMVKLCDKYNLLPLPKHGKMQNQSIHAWLIAAIQNQD